MSGELLLFLHALSGPDVTAPVISNIASSGITQTGATVSWDTDENSDSQVEYGLTTGYGSSVTLDTSPVTHHAQNLSGLVASTTYHYRVKSRDASGNLATSGDQTFNTQAVSSGTTIQSFTLKSTGSGTKPFHLGLVFKKGDVPNDPTLSGESNYQVVVKRRWNDGSAKIAIVTGLKSLSTTPVTVTVVDGTAPTGSNLTAADITAASPTASVQCGAFGTVNLSGLLGSPVRTWISGPKMVECHYRADVGGGTLLSVLFRVRLFSDGSKWIRALVENGYLDNGSGAVASNADRSYVPTIIINGVTIFNNGGSSLTHYMNTTYKAEAWFGTDPAVTFLHTKSYLTASGMVPNYGWTNPSSGTLDGLTQSYVPMGHGDIDPAMSSGGDQPEIAVLPKANALYCSSGDERALKAVIANSFSFRSYGICWRDKSTNLPIKPSDFPTWSLLGPGQNSSGYDVIRGSLQWEFNHMPGESYLAYILTGDYDHYETMLLHCSLCWVVLSSNSSRGNGTSRMMFGETRGTGWAIRNLSQLAGAFPTGDAIAAEYQTLLANNMAFFKAIADTPSMNQLGYLYEYNQSLYGVGFIAPWQQNFWIMSQGFGSDLEPIADMTVYNAVRDWMYKAPVGMAGVTGGYKWPYASAYNFKTNDGSSNNPVNWYANWGLVFSNTFPSGLPDSTLLQNTGDIAAGDPTPTTGGAGGPETAAGGRWGEYLCALAYAKKHGAAGAAAAWDRVFYSDNWAILAASGFDNDPKWGIVPPGVTVTLPAFMSGLAVNGWAQLAGSAPSLTPPSVANFGGQDFSIIDTWNGLCITKTGRVIGLATGGHADSANNSIRCYYVFEGGSWVEHLASSTSFTFDQARYADDRPASCHTYYSQHVIEARNWAVRIGSQSVAQSGNPKNVCEAFDLTTGVGVNGWAAAHTFPDIPVTFGASGAPSCKNPLTEDIYCVATNQRMMKWTQTTNTWSTVSVGFLALDYEDVCMMYDTLRNRIFLIKGVNGIHQTFNPADGTFTDVTLSGSGAGAINGALARGIGGVYIPKLDAYLMRLGGAGGAVYSINASTFAVTALSTTGGGSVPATAIISGPPENVYQKWLYVPHLGGMILFPQWSANAWFLRIY